MGKTIALRFAERLIRRDLIGGMSASFPRSLVSTNTISFAIQCSFPLSTSKLMPAIRGYVFSLKEKSWRKTCSGTASSSFSQSQDQPLGAGAVTIPWPLDAFRRRIAVASALARELRRSQPNAACIAGAPGQLEIALSPALDEIATLVILRRRGGQMEDDE